MRKTMFALFRISLVACPSYLTAQQAECKSLASANERSECYYNQLKRSEAEMQGAYKHALSLNETNQSGEGQQLPLPKLDQKLLREHQRSVVRRLRDSQRLWLEYREASCGAVENKYTGGTIVGEAVPLCKTDLTKQRTKFLRDNFGD